MLGDGTKNDETVFSRSRLVAKKHFEAALHGYHVGCKSRCKKGWILVRYDAGRFGFDKKGSKTGM